MKDLLAVNSALRALLDLAKVTGVLALITGIGFAAVVLPRRLRLVTTPLVLRASTVVVLWLVGLRLSTMAGQAASYFGLKLEPLVAVTCIAGVVASAFLMLAVRRREAVTRRGGALSALTCAFFLVVGVAALFAPPTAWDEYTHWLTLPHEMVLNNSLLSLNTYTNSVAPTYALHQSFLAAALLLAGVPDGRLNVFSVFVSAASLALVWTTLTVLRVPRRLRIGASALCAALLTASAHIFGFFYGDALTILGMAACCLGLSLIDRVRGRSEVLAAGFLVSCPLIGKGYGFVVALGTSLLVLGMGLALHLGARRRRGVLLQQPSVVVAIASLLFILLERVILYAITVHPAESNELLSAVKALDTLNQFSGKSLAFAARPLLYPKHGAMIEVWTIASVLLLISVRRIRRETPGPGRRLPLWHLTSGLVLFAVLFFALVPNPYLLGSMPRYEFGLVPTLIVTLCLLLVRSSHLEPRWQVWAQRVLIASAVFAMAWGELPGYLNDFLPRKYWNLVARDGTDPETSLYITPALALGKKEPRLRALSARYLLLSDPADGFLSYRVMSYLGRSGFRGRLYSDTTTSRSSDSGQLAEAARTALRNRNPVMLESLLSEISVVVTSLPEQVTGKGVSRVMTKQDFLATVRDGFERDPGASR